MSELEKQIAIIEARALWWVLRSDVSGYVAAVGPQSKYFEEQLSGPGPVGKGETPSAALAKSLREYDRGSN